jgi:hypothetical protein
LAAVVAALVWVAGARCGRERTTARGEVLA